MKIVLEEMLSFIFYTLKNANINISKRFLTEKIYIKNVGQINLGA